MTLYYEADDDRIVENHPDYASFDDEGRLVLDMAALRDLREEKVKALVEAAVSAAEAADIYEVEQAPELRWLAEDER